MTLGSQNKVISTTMVVLTVIMIFSSKATWTASVGTLGAGLDYDDKTDFQFKSSR